MRPTLVEVLKTGPAPSALAPAAERQAAIRRALGCVKAAKTKAAKAGGADKGNGKGRPGKAASGRAEPTAAAVWERAAALEPKAPWRALREFGVHDAVALDAYRIRALPPGFGPDAAARFLAQAAD